MSEAGEIRERAVPKINIYLPDDLADAVREAGVPVSAICQRALEHAVRRVTAIREVAASTPGDGVADPLAVNFTRRAMAVLEAAQSDAAAVPGAQVRTEHVLAALMAAGGMAVRVLGALEITPRQVEAEVHRRVPADPGVAPAAGSDAAADADRPWLSPEVAAAIELAGNESSGLGNGYVGTEHLLLGLIAEPDGVAGSVLRSLGADLRAARRTVAAALAGWFAHREQAAEQAAVAPPAEAAGPAAGIAGELSAVIKAELAPVLARIERLESRTAG